MKHLLKLILLCLMITGCSKVEIIDTYSKKTLSDYLINEFKYYTSINEDAKSEEIAKHLIQIEKVEFKGSSKKMEEGYLDGIINYKVTDFKNGACIKASKTKIPFIGYIFELDKNTDTQLFMNTLKEKADKEFKTKLDEEKDIHVINANNMVFFLICPEKIDEFY